LEEKKMKEVMFDVGYNGGMILPAKFADFFSDKPSEIFLDKSTGGIYGTKADSIISKQLKLNLGRFEAEIFVGGGKVKSRDSTPIRRYAQKRINGKQPRDFFSSHYEYFMGIRKLLDQDSLQTETLKGKLITH